MEDDQVKTLEGRTRGEISSKLEHDVRDSIDLPSYRSHVTNVTLAPITHVRMGESRTMSVACDLHDVHCLLALPYGSLRIAISEEKDLGRSAQNFDSSLTTRVSKRSMAKMYQLGIRADARTRARWVRKAKIAGMSLNKWAMLILDSAPETKPSIVYYDSAKNKEA